MTTNPTDRNFDANTQCNVEINVKNPRRIRQFDDTIVFKHKHIDFGLRYVSSVKRSAKIVDNVLNVYWPESFNFHNIYASNQSPTRAQLISWAISLGYLRSWKMELVDDLGQYEFEIFGYVTEQPRRLFALKSVIMCCIWHDLFEDLIRDGFGFATIRLGPEQ